MYCARFLMDFSMHRQQAKARHPMYQQDLSFHANI
jgi:hypothetical protein